MRERVHGARFFHRIGQNFEKELTVNPRSTVEALKAERWGFIGSQLA
jgi:hypothetical protein